MFFPFECKVCKKDKWIIRYDSEERIHILTCANCGTTEILEDIFGNRRSKKNVKHKVKKNIKEAVGENNTSHNTETNDNNKDTINEITDTEQD